MRPLDPIQDDQLIAFACGCMPLEERAALAARMVDDPELAARAETIRRALRPLEAWRAPEPDAEAVAAIMGRVAESSPLKYVANAAALTPAEIGRSDGADGGVGERRSRFTLVQFFAVAASIALVLSVLFPTMQRRHDERIQAGCGLRMRDLGLGLAQYATEYDGAFPRVDGQRSANWLNQPQRRHFIPLLRLNLVAPSALYCPTTGQLEIDNEAIRRELESFLQRADLRFYAVQHPGAGGADASRTVRMPVVGDENPLFSRGQVAPHADDSANSPAHRGHGQNVLFNDGSAEFLSSPRFRELDNIWRPEGRIPNYTGTEAPTSATDSFLVP